MNSNAPHHLVMPLGTTLDRYIQHRQNAFAFATGELSQLLRDIALAGKIVHREVNRAGSYRPDGRHGIAECAG